MRFDPDGTLTTSVFHCARCHGDHVSLTFSPLTYPVEDDDGTIWDFWTLCPTNHEPILLRTQKPPTPQEIIRAFAPNRPLPDAEGDA